MFFFFFDDSAGNRASSLVPQIVEGTSEVATPVNCAKYLRIHGDNIVECERTLELIKKAYDGKTVLLPSPLYMPKYQLDCDGGYFVIELLSGHGRWGVDIASILQENGGILHEGADSYVTEVAGNQERVIFALEYCSALPAGNNAWQRSGRAISAVLAGVPYLYYAEIGGVELDGEREVKAPRFPNPVVPFSYLMTSKKYSSLCVPVYKTHPSITKELYNKFKDVIGVDDSLKIIRGLIDGSSIETATNILIDKDLKLVKLLSDDRKTNDTLRGDQWDQLLAASKPEEWLSTYTRSLVWKKKTSDKVLVSKSFKTLLNSVMGYNCRTIGSKDLPICIIPADMLSTFENLLKNLYPKLGIIIKKDRPLAIVWITGFKPRGDDSRPDRGLSPLARMTLGSSVEMMTIVYGPAKTSTWAQMKASLDRLCSENGLWQAVFNLSNHVLVDSATLSEPRYFYKDCILKKNPSSIMFGKAGVPVAFSEDDTDCAIHQIFAHKSELGILEGMCNPPGGDWSGVSCFRQDEEYRWTSLPRVSPIGGKRPDHVIQIATSDKNIFLSIESKGKGVDLEDNIGTHLSDYMIDLFSSIPTAHRKVNGEWHSMDNYTPCFPPYILYSVGAFLYKNDAELSTHLSRGNLDAILAFELGPETVVHVKDGTSGHIIVDVLKRAKSVMGGFKIQVH